MSIFAAGMVQKVKNPRVRAFILHAHTVRRREQRKRALKRANQHLQAQSEAEAKKARARANRLAALARANAAKAAKRAAAKQDG